MDDLMGEHRLHPKEPLLVDHQTCDTLPPVKGEGSHSSEAANSGKAAAKLSIWDVVRLANPPGGSGEKKTLEASFSQTKREARSRSTSPVEGNPTRGTKRDQNAFTNAFELAAISMRMSREGRVVPQERVRAAAPRTAEVTLEEPAIHWHNPTPPTGASLPQPRRFAAVGVAAVIEASMAWSPCDGAENPLLAFLAAGNARQGRRGREPGWMRRREARLRRREARLRGAPPPPDAHERKHLTPTENTALVETKREVDRVRLTYGGTFPAGLTPLADLRHAYGVSKNKVQGCVQKFVRNDFSSARKANGSVGETVLTSARKRDLVLTPLEYYRRWRRQGRAGAPPDAVLRSDFAALDEGERRRCRDGAAALRRALAEVDIDEEIRRALRETEGTLSWERLAELVAGGADRVQAVGKRALYLHVQASEDLRRRMAGRVRVQGRPP